MAENIEEKEIRGINFKLIRALVVSVVAVVGSVLFSYYNLRLSIKELQLEKVGDSKYTDLKIKTIEMNMSAMQIQIDNIRSQVDETKKLLNK